MLLYLKALEIQGFKSFPDKTRLTFEKDITAIVGPNGSGKSNISDALLWVMGEQRTRALRGGKMEDVIFGGTEKRPPMGFAQVSLIIDNSAGLFDVDSADVTITRRYYRSGESEYFLNHESVRLRDITSLLMDTGLGRDGYSVIGQGRIAEIVSAKSTDRREIFEEAAGIARYRSRKEEAERKLAHTNENLLRINDKIDELKLRVDPLREQSEKAKRYLVLRDEQRALEISVWVENLDRLHEKSELLASDCTGAKNALETAQDELEALYAGSENINEKMRECDVRLESERAELSRREAEAAECDSAAAVLRANLGHNEETIERSEAELGERTGRARELRDRIEENERALQELAARRAESELALRERSSETEKILGRSNETEGRLLDIISRENAAGETLARAQTALNLLADRRSELEARNVSIGSELASMEEKNEAARAGLREAIEAENRAKERLEEINNALSGRAMLIQGREKRVGELTAQLNSLTVEKRSTESRINLLSEMEKDYEGLGKAVKSVMREVSRGALRGIHGPVASLIKVDDRFAVAIETALGGAMQNIVVDDQERGKAAIEMLKRTDGGRATFLPIATIRPHGGSMPEGEEGSFGAASELVSFDPKYRGIFENLLGRTLVVETLSDAVRISKKHDNRLRIVSLDGQMINAGGSMTGGSAARNVGILSRANELRRLRGAHAKLTESEKTCEAELEAAKRELERARYELETARAELDKASELCHRRESETAQRRLLLSAGEDRLEELEREKSALSGQLRDISEREAQAGADAKQAEAELGELRRQAGDLTGENDRLKEEYDRASAELAAVREAIASMDSESEATLRSNESLSELLKTADADETERRAQIELLRKKSLDIKAEIEEKLRLAAGMAERIGKIKSAIAELSALRLSLEGKRTQSDKAAQDKNRELLELRSTLSALEQKLLSAELEEKQIVDKLWDSYELSRSAAQELRQPVESMTQANKRIGELRRAISGLGNVNVGAIEEYGVVKERYDFLTGQRDDVVKAAGELEEIISGITSEMKEIFVREFRLINEEFRRVFLDLFGGGKAELRLEDEDNVLECGIDIKVQPPGKAVTTISLLSGGEKSFVAIALYFAIMRVRPTPFCIMDEIEAALDEANVERFASYMRGMTGSTQFIVITHRRGTMEEADMLYGVTMQEKGVTSVISVDLDEAEKTIG